MAKDYRIDREDMLELTRRMTLSRNCFTRVAGCYLDKHGELDDTFNTSFIGLKPADKKQNLEMAKTIPFGRTNDQLKGYIIPENAMGKGSFYQLLNGVLQCELKNDLLMEILYEQIAKNYSKSPDAAIYIYHGSYDIKSKAADGEYLEGSEAVYDFLICTIAPVLFDYEPDMPEFGFLFPAFYERSMTRNAINIFTKRSEEQETKLLRMILGE
ncbi:MAG: DUF4317 family protein [Lachnospiraceae bacterium]|nr:DUF4317 family protein [Lachnospiraceae bacterium]